MADEVNRFSFFGSLKMLVLTAMIAGMCYWLWQDIPALLRPLRGDFWTFVKDLDILVNGAAIFLFLTLVALVFDQNGTQNSRARFVAGLSLTGLIALLLVYGQFFQKQISPLFS